ncbi:MAG: hypothetical protein ACOYL8_04600 [Patescibacteria group bacterium]
MATKQQIPKVAAIIVEFQEVFEGLSNDDAQWIIQHGKEANELFVDLIKNGKKENVLSEVLAQQSIKESGGDFSIRDNFSTDNPKVSFSYINSNFKNWFGDIVEENVRGINSNIYSRRIRRKPARNNDSILAELGGIENACLFFKEIYWLLFYEEYNNLLGDKNLISRIEPNKLIVLHKSGRPCLVDFTWYYSGWRVNAYPFGMTSLLLQPGSIVYSHLP